MMLTRYLFVIALTAMLIAVGIPTLSTAREKPSPLEILEKMDTVISGYNDQLMEIEMVIIDVDGSRKSYKFVMYQKKGGKRLVRFTSGDLKGMSVLTLPGGRAYVYLSGYKRVRRVAAHNMKQTIAGSDFTQEDMATTNWAELYDAELLSEDEGFWRLRCNPKDERKMGHAYAILKIGKKEFRQWGVEYYNDKGEMIKFLDNENIKTFNSGARCHGRVRLTDARTGHKTDLNILDFKVNQGLKDKFFTTRHMQWGR